MNPRCFLSWRFTFSNMKKTSEKGKEKTNLTVVETEEDEIELYELPEIEVEEIELPEKNYSD